MDVIINSKEENNEDQIWRVLKILKKRINQYHLIHTDTRSKAELTRSERIQKLVMEEQHLSAQFEKIQKEIKRYERKYEKVLKKKVKTMKVQIKEDRARLEVIKQKYCELNVKKDVTLYGVDKEKVKKKKIKTKAIKSKFSQRTMPFSKKIRIKIRTNRKRDNRREVHFVNNKIVNNAQSAFTDLLKVVKPVTMSTRECRVILQRLTEEQMSRHLNQKRLGSQRRERKRVTRGSSRKSNEFGTTVAEPTWNIKIPKSVLDESQEKLQNYNLNVALCSREAT